MKPAQKIKRRQKDLIDRRRPIWQSRTNCLCCGCKTIQQRGTFGICPVCFWEDDAYFDFDRFAEPTLFNPVYGTHGQTEPPLELLLDRPSAANAGLTLRQARNHYQTFGASAAKWRPFVRRPLSQELCLFRQPENPQHKEKP